MSSAAVAPTAVSRPAINPWFVAAAVVVPTFMEVLDTTIANVALRYIAGGLSASNVDSEWVLTSYLAANATILPISGWLSAHLGRRNYFLLSIAVFTIASGLCGMATSLEQLILFRVIQGLAGGGLQPSSQGVLLDSFPPEKQGAAQTMFGIAALLAPVVGPTLGGYLTVNYNWRWIFYINIPVGALGFLASFLLVKDPDYLRNQRAELRRQPLNFDYIGLGLLVLVMSSWEIMLSKGQQWDWYNDPFLRVQTLFVLFTGGLCALIFRELRIAHPVVDFRPLAERNFAGSCVIIFCSFAVLYGASTSLPGLLQSLFGYDAYVSGLVQSPSGVFSVLMLVVVGTVLGWGTDARWLIACGLLVMAAGNYWMAMLNLYVSADIVIWPRIVLICGLSMIFAPINVAAFKYTPAHLRRPPSACLPCFETKGAAWARRWPRPWSSAVNSFTTRGSANSWTRSTPRFKHSLNKAGQLSCSKPATRSASQEMALEVLENLRQQQALSLAYFDTFWLFAVLALVLLPLVLLMKPSAAEKGAHIAAE